MGFTSNIGNCPIIDDDNFGKYVDDADIDPEKGRGRIPRDYAKEPYASNPFAGPLKLPLIDPDDYDRRIREQEETKSSLYHLAKLKGWKVKNQARTNYCWINAPTACVELLRIKQGLDYVSLSPASAGAKITNFKNVGGWGTRGVEYVVDEGLVPTPNWPDNAIDRKYDTPENNALRARYQVDEWWDMRPRNMQELYTCLLNNVPVAIGLNWWGHEVTAIQMVKIGNKTYAIRIANSWGETWGEDGYGILSGSKQVADDQVCPASVTGGNPNTQRQHSMAV